MAWPGPRGCNHMLIIGVGCGLEASEEENNTAKRLAAEAPNTLMGDEMKIYSAPNAIEEWHEPESVSTSATEYMAINLMLGILKSFTDVVCI